jgi:hypothetical protein
MRASPAFEVTLHRFGVWRGAVLMLGGLGVAAMAAWLVTREVPVGIPLAIAGASAAVTLLWLAVSLAHVPAVALRWDGLLWHLGSPAAAGPDDSMPGDVAVILDLGSWMLLRFTPAVPHAQPRVTWLPVQRRGIETQWHALRCSVYSPHPASATDTPRES